MTYQCTDRAEYVKSGKKLSEETIEMLSAYFQSLFAQRKIDGTLERHEIERLRNRAKRTLANNLPEKREARRSSHAHREVRKRERGCRHGSRSHRRGSDDRRPTSYDRSGRDGRNPNNNQPKCGDRDGGGNRGRRREGNDRGTAPKKGSWKRDHDDKNQRDDRDRRDDRERRKKSEMHHVDSRYTSSNDDMKLDDEHTDVDDDDASKSTASSGAADNNFSMFESPAKLAAEAKRGSAVANKEVATACKCKPDVATVSPEKKKAKPSKKVIESDSDEENDDDENFLASCGKVLDRNPLDI
jgi:hypothetical protein